MSTAFLTIDRASGKPRKTVADAIKAFLKQHEENAAEKQRKYVRILNGFASFCMRRAFISSTKPISS